MTEQPSQEFDVPVAPVAAKLRWWGAVIWAPACLLLGAALAWGACQAQKSFAPWLVFPLVVGILAGILLVGLSRTLRIGARWAILPGTILASLVVIVGQHYASYALERANLDRDTALFQRAFELHPDLLVGDAPPPDRGFLTYMRRQAAIGRPMFGSTVARCGWAWASWALDGAILAAGSLLVVVPASRQPYCNRCRSWFQTTRRNALTVEAARRVAAAAGVELPDGFVSAGCRVVSCRGGCGPIGFEIWSEQPRAKRSVVRRWLDLDTAYQIPRAIDEHSVGK